MALNDVPKSTQTLVQTQAPIEQNFSTIDTAFSINHVPYNLAGGTQQGKHLLVQFPVGADIVGLANEIAIYNSQATTVGVQAPAIGANGTSQLWLKRENSTSFPFTYGVAAEAGWTYLPSGMRLIWGTVSASTSGLTTLSIVFSAYIPTFPAFTTFSWGPFTTRGNANSSTVYVSASNNLGFSLRRSSGATFTSGASYRWLAIGL